MTKYGVATNADDIAKEYNLTGKNVIVTGGYTGIGRDTSRAFALAGANVYVVGRDLPKANKAVAELKAETGKQNFTTMEVELGSLDSVRKFCEKFNQLNIPLHYLILNAGIMGVDYGKTVDGFELHFGVNFLGHFLMTNLLIDRLIQGAPSRVISVSSAGHSFQGIRWDDYNFEKGPYQKFVGYGQSKTANILMAVELTRRYKEKGVIANALHPGYIYGTELARNFDLSEVAPEKLRELPNFEGLMQYSYTPKTNNQGASTTLYAALSPDAAEGGKFYDDCAEKAAQSYASDPENAKRLWELATKLVKL